MKSLFGMTLFEGNGVSPEGETYQQKQISFASLPDVARLFLQIASGAADIPVTRMLGQAPAGLNATGDSDTRNYYDRVRKNCCSSIAWAAFGRPLALLRTGR